MPTSAAERPPARRRLALPLTAGLALWLFSYHVLALPGTSDGAGIATWALTLRWVVGTTGAAVALACAHGLARRLEARLSGRDRTPDVPPATPPGRRRPSPATALVAVGAAVTALAELSWFHLGPLPSWAFTLLDVVGGVVAPAALALGVYLAVRRLEDHLAGRSRVRPPKGEDAAGRRHASGLTSPYVVR